MSRAHPRNSSRGRGINRGRARCLESGHAGFGGRLRGKGPNLGNPGKEPRRAADPTTYLAEAAGLEVWLVNARDVKHLPGRGKSDRLDCVWHCKLNERGMLRRSFVPPEPVRDLRALTRTRARLAQDQARHQARVEKILEDALLKISVVISDLFGASGRRFLDALVAGERSPTALAALGDPRLKATRRELEDALTGRFRDIHAFEIQTHLRLIDAINDEITRLDEAIGQQLAKVPRTAPACTACGLAGGGHAPGCAEQVPPLRAGRAAG